MRRLLLTIACLAVPSAILLAQKTDLMVALKFVPQTSVRTGSVALPPGVIDRTVDIQVVESREQADPRVIGTGTNDDDETFQIKSSVDVAPFVNEAVAKLATAHNFKTGSPSERVLQLRLTRFAVTESNKAIGSTYNAEVHFAFTLLDGAGTTLAQGAASGVANRYGRARSGANCAEVLSDALNEAFSSTVGDASLQQAWSSGRPLTSGAAPAALPAAAPAGTIEERLKRLDDLLQKGLITKDEYATRRAAILKEL